MRGLEKEWEGQSKLRTTNCGTYFLYFTCDPFYSFSNPLIPTTSTLPNYFLLLFTLLLHPTIVFLPILHSFSTSTHLFMLYSIGNTARFPKDHTPQVRPDLVPAVYFCFFLHLFQYIYLLHIIRFSKHSFLILLKSFF